MQGPGLTRTNLDLKFDFPWTLADLQPKIVTIYGTRSLYAMPARSIRCRGFRLVLLTTSHIVHAADLRSLLRLMLSDGKILNKDAMSLCSNQISRFPCTTMPPGDAAKVMFYPSILGVRPQCFDVMPQKRVTSMMMKLSGYSRP